MANNLTIPLTQEEFTRFRQLLYRISGINLSDLKRDMVSGRLQQRLRHHGLDSYGDYFRLLTEQPGGGDPQKGSELQIALDLLTTNETYFFRERRHLDYLRDHILKDVRPGRPFRVWSAACSSGEEPYSVAMVLMDRLGQQPWEIVGSDLSTRVLEKAQNAQYPMERAKDIPKEYLVKYCLKGVRSQAGTFLIDPELRRRVRFQQVNLNNELPAMGEFDVIFLRNVMIYFDPATKQAVVGRLLHFLRDGGRFIVGLSETLSGISDRMQTEAPTVYKKLAPGESGARQAGRKPHPAQPAHR